MPLPPSRLRLRDVPKSMYRCRTQAGSFYLAPFRGGWEAQHAGETLGSRWPTAEEALHELVAGRTRLTKDGTDPSTVGIPMTIDQWEQLRAS